MDDTLHRVGDTALNNNLMRHWDLDDFRHRDLSGNLNHSLHNLLNWVGHIALDNLLSGKKENLDPRVRLVVHDIRSPEAAELIRTEKPQVLCHLAAQMDVRKSVADPVLGFDWLGVG